MRKKRKLFLETLILAVALSLGIALMATAAPGIELGDGIALTAEVVAIDKADRTLTLRGAEGNIVTLEVGEEARNFDQIEIGDNLNVEYYESVALYLGKAGQKPDVASGQVVARSEKGDKPAGVVMEIVDVSATIQSIDKKTRHVTLKLPDGRVVDKKVDPSVKAFDSLKVGDAVHAMFTEAIAISVVKP